MGAVATASTRCLPGNRSLASSAATANPSTAAIGIAIAVISKDRMSGAKSTWLVPSRPACLGLAWEEKSVATHDDPPLVGGDERGEALRGLVRGAALPFAGHKRLIDPIVRRRIDGRIGAVRGHRGEREGDNRDVGVAGLR